MRASTCLAKNRSSRASMMRGLVTAAAERAGKIVHTVHNWLKAPICRTISSLVEGGAIGAVQSVQWRTLRTRARGRRGFGGRGELARRSEARGRRHPVRSRLARALLRRALGGRSLWRRRRGSRPAGITNGRSKTPRRSNSRPLPARARSFSPGLRTSVSTRSRSRGSAATFASRAIRSFCALAEGEQRFSCPPALSEGSHHPDWFDGVAEDFLRAANGEGEDNLVRGSALRPSDRRGPAFKRLGRRAPRPHRLTRARARRRTRPDRNKSARRWPRARGTSSTCPRARERSRDR